MMSASVPASLLLVAAAAILAGCQSTQAKSAQIAAELGPVKVEKGLKIKKESEDVEVLGTKLLSDPNGTAVVVEVRNTSDQTLADVPIAINVLDAKGKSVFKNNLPGIEPALASIPLIKPGETIDWVNNQVLPLGDPRQVKAEVGAEARPYPGPIPDVVVSAPHLENDRFSGFNASGTVVNKEDVQQDRVLIFAVATDNGEIVAAGRGAVEKLNPDRTKVYHAYFIGNPEGADLSIDSFPTLATQTETKGSSK